MDTEAATKAARIAGQRPPGSSSTARRRRRRIAGIVLVALAAAAAAGAGILYRKRSADRATPADRAARHRVAAGWTVPVPLPAAANELETNVRRLLARESSVLGATAALAGRVPNLAALAASSIDGASFQDALSTEPWWKDFRAYGCSVLLGDEVKLVWQMPETGLSPVELARAVGAAPANSPAGARLVSGPNGIVLGALAPIEGVKDARVLLVQAVNRQSVAGLAARANIVMVLSDGRKNLGASAPNNTLPELDGLIAKEGSHVLVEKGLGRLAVAVPWADGLWLWAVRGWEP